MRKKEEKQVYLAGITQKTKRMTHFYYGSSSRRSEKQTVMGMGVKGTLSGLRQFLATENLLRMIKIAFYFTLKALFVLKILEFLS